MQAIKNRDQRLPRRLKSKSKETAHLQVVVRVGVVVTLEELAGLDTREEGRSRDVLEGEDSVSQSERVSLRKGVAQLTSS